MKIGKCFSIIINKIKREIFYYRNRKKIGPDLFGVKILTIDETIQFMQKQGHSIVRFGDGEFMLMNGKSINFYQECDAVLKDRLIEVFNSQNDNLLVCLPEPMSGITAYRHQSQVHWTYHLLTDEDTYRSVIKRDRVYGNSFVSRPYMIYRDKKQSEKWFAEIKDLFKDKDIVIIEGEYSRTGVGNDLFAGARTVKRILCPGHNAFNRYDQILEEALKVDRDALILVAIGPAGKVLAKDMVSHGYCVYDMGHIDSEYEWYRSKAKTKSKVKNKHTADIKDEKIGECQDKAYIDSIIARIIG